MEAPSAAPEGVREKTKTRWLILLLLTLAFICMVTSIAIPNLLRSRIAANQARTRSVYGFGDISAESKPDGSLDARKQVMTLSLSLLVADPSAATENVHELARRLHGHVERSELGRSHATAPESAQIVIRIPAAAVGTARVELRKLALRVENERIQAKDVTGEYVDLEANIRNLQAEEAQYRQIMARASSIKDTLAVAERLADVRGRIETAQAQFNVLSRQVEMATIELTLNTEPVLVIPGVEWRPWDHAREAWRAARQDLADFANFALTLLIRFPVFVLWTVSLFGLGMVAWKILRWIWKRFLLPAAQGA
jgi:hypothetical protein